MTARPAFQRYQSNGVKSAWKRLESLRKKGWKALGLDSSVLWSRTISRHWEDRSPEGGALSSEGAAENAEGINVTEALARHQHQQEGFAADNTNAEDAILQERHQIDTGHFRPPSVAEVNKPFVGQAPAYYDSIDNAIAGGPDLFLMQRDQVRMDS